jgi:hypothetical protein
VSIWANIIKRFKAPALPVASRTYDPQYFDKLLSVLRIYFNQLDNLLEQIVSASPVAVNFYGSALDAFGRARFSQPFTLFDSQNRYAKNDLFSESTATGGNVTYSANSSTVELNVTTSSGSEVVRQTYRSFSYQPGKSLLVLNTFVMPTANENQRIRIGYFNTENGVFLERDGTTVYIVRRTYVTGVAVDTRVAQADWNGDKLNGTGDSGFTLDLTKAQIFWEDFEWLGVGSVRAGFVINGQVIICHTFQNANNLTSVYMTTAILPVRYEITNTGVSTAATLKQICSTVISEGGYEKRVATDVVRMTTANTNIGVNFVPLMSIRLASGRTGAVVIPDGYSVLPTATSTVTFEVAMIKNATLTGASWAASPSANVEQDLSATALTGGTIIFSSYVVASTQSSAPIANGADYNWDLQLGATLAGVSDTYTIAVRALSGTHDAIGTMAFWDLT